jgi:photosystem II stability/assembly factor-like uncharacterized protein
MSFRNIIPSGARDLARILVITMPILVIAMFTTPAHGQAPVLTDQSMKSTVRFQAVSALSGQVAWISGTRGTWARTLDGGKTWQAGMVPGADSLEFRDVQAASADTAWLLSAGNGDKSRIYHTVNGGSSWSIQFVSTDQRAFFDCIAFWDARRGIAIGDAVEKAFILLRTEDGGSTWNRVNGLPPAAEGEGLFAASGTCLLTGPDGAGWFGTGAAKTARVGRTRDYGKTWTIAKTPIVQNTTSSGLTSLAFWDAHRGLGVGGDLNVTKERTANVAISEDGGATWSPGGSLAFLGPAYGSAVVPGRSLTAIAVGPGGSAWTSDGGATWRSIDSNDYWSVGFAPDGTGWMVGPAGRIARVELK